MRIVNLLTESLVNPMGVDFRAPRLSWQIAGECRGTMQAAFQVMVREEEQGELFDSGRVESGETFLLLSNLKLRSRGRYFWRVRAWDTFGNEAISADAFWEMGLLDESEWQAEWIEPEQPRQFVTAQLVKDFRVYEELPDTSNCVPCHLLRREFCVTKPVRRARAYATAHGLYRLELNGRRVGDLELTPEPTSYDKYLQYQTYDVTELLNAGENCVGIHIAPGWWSGVIGLYSASCQYGDTIAALMQLEILYVDGTRETICTDDAFRSGVSPVQYAEIYMGEKYDANLEQAGWSCPGFAARDWKRVKCLSGYKSMLRGQDAEPIRVCRRYPAVRVFRTPKGEKMIDFGQVTAGKAHIEFSGAPGTEVRFRYTQELNKEGNYSLNITGNYNQATDTYIIGPDGHGVHEPLFVYHGFRYVMVEGEVQIDEKTLTALSMGSSLEETGRFSCSDSLVNRVQENIRWSLLGNFMGIPTDNPDRERAGWTGDAQMIVETACYNLGLAAFWRRWLEQMRLEQRADGKIPFIVPNWRCYDESDERRGKNTAAGWGDACIIVPWMNYMRYGDKRVLEENYTMMKRWLEYVAVEAAKNPDDIGELTPERAERLKYIWNTGWQYGDWLTPSDCTDDEGNFRYLPRKWPLKYFTPSCFYIYSADLMTKIALLLNRPEDSERYAALAQKIREASRTELYDERGIPKEDRQGAQIFTLYFHVLPQEYEDMILQHLLDQIRENGGRMDTGFSSTQYLPDVLTRAGKVKEAYDCLFSPEPPSWIYEVKKGATGVWEGWQAVMPDGTVNPVSFLQYGNAVIGNWLYSTVAGIRPEEPGFAKICISPEFDDRLDSAAATYRSVHGEIASAWEKRGGKVVLRVKIPANTEAVIALPGAKAERVLESGKPLSEAEGVRGARLRGEKLEVSVGSGEYSFAYETDAEQKEAMR